MGLITIELIDDLRSNFGDRNISYIDEEVYHDIYGFPFLPAWEIRNSLFGIAQEILTEEEIRGIFGDPSQEGSLVMENAVIASRESLRYALVSSSDNRIRNPHMVLKQFTEDRKYFRGGKECSCRLLNSGLVFEQCFRLDRKYRSSFERLVSACVGFEHCSGRVHCDLDWDLGEEFVYGSGELSGGGKKAEYGFHRETEGSGLCRMEFSLKLLSPLCVFEPLDVTHETKNFIPGELIEKALHTDRSITDRIRTSFAFCEVDGERSQPVSIAFSVLKTDKNELRDKLSDGRRPNDFSQLKKLSGLYMNSVEAEDVLLCSVETEYGKVHLKKQKNETVLSYQAISAEQTMRGFFEGPGECIDAVLESITEDRYLKIGDFSEIGFGLCRIQVERLWNIDCTEDEKNAEEIRVDVLSPVAIQQDNGVYTDCAEQFLAAMKRFYNMDDLEIISNCKDTDMIQGYSREWIKKNALMYLIKGGSSFRIRSKSGRMIPVCNRTVFVGNYTQYGFGELNICSMKDMYYRTAKKLCFDRYNKNIGVPFDTKPGKSFMRQLRTVYIRALAVALGRIDAENFYGSYYTFARDLIKEQFDCEVDEAEVLEQYLSGIREACEYIRFDKTDKPRI